MSYSETVKKAEAYYDSDDADNFYFEVWGGEDLHIGCYDAGATSIHDASWESVKRIADHLKHWPEGARLIDIGSGFGGTGRYLQTQRKFDVTCLNLSDVQNRRNKEKNKASGIDMEVITASFEAIPCKDASFDIVWSQDSILHSGNKKLVFEEVNRILKPGGEFVFTDPMQKADAPKEDLQPVLDRIHLESMGSVDLYKQLAGELAWETLNVTLLTDQMITHYATVKKVLAEKRESLEGKVSDAYIDRMSTGLQHWVDAGNKGALDWGILHFKKPA